MASSNYGLGNRSNYKGLSEEDVYDSYDQGDAAIDSFQSGAYSGAEAFGHLVDSDMIENWGREGRIANQLEAQRYTPDGPQRVEDIDSIAGGLDWAGDRVIENLPQLGSQIVASGLGGLVGGVPGAIAAGAAASVPQLMGETYQRQLKKGVVDKGALIGSTLAKSAMELIPVGTAVNTAAKLGIGTMGRAVAKQMLAEGIPEAGQGVATEWAAGINPNTSKEYLSDRLNEFAAGTVVGSATGAAAQGANYVGQGVNALRGAPEQLQNLRDQGQAKYDGFVENQEKYGIMGKSIDPFFHEMIVRARSKGPTALSTQEKEMLASLSPEDMFNSTGMTHEEFFDHRRANDMFEADPQQTAGSPMGDLMIPGAEQDQLARYDVENLKQQAINAEEAQYFRDNNIERMSSVFDEPKTMDDRYGLMTHDEHQQMAEEDAEAAQAKEIGEYDFVKWYKSKADLKRAEAEILAEAFVTDTETEAQVALFERESPEYQQYVARLTLEKAKRLDEDSELGKLAVEKEQQYDNVGEARTAFTSADNNTDRNLALDAIESFEKGIYQDRLSPMVDSDTGEDSGSGDYQGVNLSEATNTRYIGTGQINKKTGKPYSKVNPILSPTRTRSMRHNPRVRDTIAKQQAEIDVYNENSPNFYSQIPLTKALYEEEYRSFYKDSDAPANISSIDPLTGKSDSNLSAGSQFESNLQDRKKAVATDIINKLKAKIIRDGGKGGALANALIAKFKVAQKDGNYDPVLDAYDVIAVYAKPTDLLGDTHSFDLETRRKLEETREKSYGNNIGLNSIRHGYLPITADPKDWNVDQNEDTVLDFPKAVRTRAHQLVKAGGYDVDPQDFIKLFNENDPSIKEVEREAISSVLHEYSERLAPELKGKTDIVDDIKFEMDGRLSTVRDISAKGDLTAIKRMISDNKLDTNITPFRLDVITKNYNPASKQNFVPSTQVFRKENELTAEQKADPLGNGLLPIREYKDGKKVIYEAGYIDITNAINHIKRYQTNLKSGAVKPSTPIKQSQTSQRGKSLTSKQAARMLFKAYITKVNHGAIPSTGETVTIQDLFDKGLPSRNDWIDTGKQKFRAAEGKTKKDLRARTAKGMLTGDATVKAAEDVTALENSLESMYAQRKAWSSFRNDILGDDTRKDEYDEATRDINMLAAKIDSAEKNLKEIKSAARNTTVSERAAKQDEVKTAKPADMNPTYRDSKDTNEWVTQLFNVVGGLDSYLTAYPDPKNVYKWADKNGVDINQFEDYIRIKDPAADKARLYDLRAQLNNIKDKLDKRGEETTETILEELVQDLDAKRDKIKADIRRTKREKKGSENKRHDVIKRVNALKQESRSVIDEQLAYLTTTKDKERTGIKNAQTVISAYEKDIETIQNRLKEGTAFKEEAKAKAIDELLKFIPKGYQLSSDIRSWRETARNKEMRDPDDTNWTDPPKYNRALVAREKGISDEEYKADLRQAEGEMLLAFLDNSYTGKFDDKFRLNIPEDNFDRNKLIKTLRKKIDILFSPEETSTPMTPDQAIKQLQHLGLWSKEGASTKTGRKDKQGRHIREPLAPMSLLSYDALDAQGIPHVQAHEYETKLMRKATQIRMADEQNKITSEYGLTPKEQFQKQKDIDYTYMDPGEFVQEAGLDMDPDKLQADFEAKTVGPAFVDTLDARGNKVRNKLPQANYQETKENKARQLSDSDDNIGIAGNKTNTTPAYADTLAIEEQNIKTSKFDEKTEGVLKEDNYFPDTKDISDADIKKRINKLRERLGAIEEERGVLLDKEAEYFYSEESVTEYDDDDDDSKSAHAEYLDSQMETLSLEEERILDNLKIWTDRLSADTTTVAKQAKVVNKVINKVVLSPNKAEASSAMYLMSIDQFESAVEQADQDLLISEVDNQIKQISLKHPKGIRPNEEMAKLKLIQSQLIGRNPAPDTEYMKKFEQGPLYGSKPDEQVREEAIRDEAEAEKNTTKKGRKIRESRQRSAALAKIRNTIEDYNKLTRNQAKNSKRKVREADLYDATPKDWVAPDRSNKVELDDDGNPIRPLDFEANYEPVNVYYGNGKNGDNAILSNFAERPFTLTKDGKEFKFKRVEQYFQMVKAKMAGDTNSLKALSKSKSGKQDKSLGGKVRGFKTIKQNWDNNSQKIMENAVYISMVQNPAAAEALVNTYPNIITHTQDKGPWGKKFPEVLHEVRKRLIADKVVPVNKLPASLRNAPKEEVDSEAIRGQTLHDNKWTGRFNTHAKKEYDRQIAEFNLKALSPAEARRVKERIQSRIEAGRIDWIKTTQEKEAIYVRSGKQKFDTFEEYAGYEWNRQVNNLDFTGMSDKEIDATKKKIEEEINTEEDLWNKRQIDDEVLGNKTQTDDEVSMEDMEDSAPPIDFGDLTGKKTTSHAPLTIKTVVFDPNVANIESTQDTLAKLAKHSPRGHEIKVAEVERQAAIPKGFKLTQKVSNKALFTKDQAKADASNAYIGYGQGSTGQYKADAIKQGLPVNSQILPTADTVAFASVNGGMKLTPANYLNTMDNIYTVLKSGGTVILDNKFHSTDPSRSYNKWGEGKVRRALMSDASVTSTEHELYTSYVLQKPDSKPTSSSPSPTPDKRNNTPLRKIISGGQTGGDYGGLLAGKQLGLETGGTAPKGFKTDAQNQMKMADNLRQMGVTEHTSTSYVPRTKQNVDDSDGTVAFIDPDTKSVGTSKTIGYAKTHSWQYDTNTSSDTGYKPVLVLNPKESIEANAKLLNEFLSRNDIKTLNVAGHRERSVVGITKIVRDVISLAVKSSTPDKSTKSDPNANPSIEAAAPTVKVVPLSDIQAAENRGEGINVLRKATKFHYGNPFGVKGVKTRATVPNAGNVAETAKMYTDWVNGEYRADVEPERLEWIQNQIINGELDGKTLLYFKNTPVNHAKELAKIVKEFQEYDAQNKIEIESTEAELTPYVMKNFENLRLNIDWEEGRLANFKKEPAHRRDNEAFNKQRKVVDDLKAERAQFIEKFDGIEQATKDMVSEQIAKSEKANIKTRTSPEGVEIPLHTYDKDTRPAHKIGMDLYNEYITKSKASILGKQKQLFHKSENHNYGDMGENINFAAGDLSIIEGLMHKRGIKIPDEFLGAKGPNWSDERHDYELATQAVDGAEYNLSEAPESQKKGAKANLERLKAEQKEALIAWENADVFDSPMKDKETKKSLYRELTKAEDLLPTAAFSEDDYYKREDFEHAVRDIISRGLTAEEAAAHLEYDSVQDLENEFRDDRFGPLKDKETNEAVDFGDLKSGKGSKLKFAKNIAVETLPTYAESNMNSAKNLLKNKEMQHMADRMLQGTGLKVKILNYRQALRLAQQMGAEQSDTVLGMKNHTLHGFAHSVMNSDGTYHIYVNPEMNDSLRAEILAHELGHITMYGSNLHEKASEAEARGVLREFGKWLKKMNRPDTTYQELLASKKTPLAILENLKYGAANTRINDMHAEGQTYLKDFDEWYADEAGKALLQSLEGKRPTNFIQRYFRKIIQNLKRIYAELTGGSQSGYKVNHEVAKYIEGLRSKQGVTEQYNLDLADTATQQAHLALSAKAPAAQAKSLDEKINSAMDSNFWNKFKAVVFDKDQNLRMMVDSKGNAIPSMIKLADLFHKERGSTESSNSYWDAKMSHMSKYDKRMADIMRGTTVDQQNIIMQQLYDEKLSDRVVSGKTKAIRELFRDLRQYMGDAGLEFNTRKNYFPEIANREYVQDNEQAFKDMMAKYTKEMNGIADKWNKDLIKSNKNLMRDAPTDEELITGADVPQKLFDAIIGNEGVYDEAFSGQQKPAVRAMNHRIISFLDAKDRADWTENYLQRSVTDATSSYIMHAVKRVEYEKRFGKLGAAEQAEFIDADFRRRGIIAPNATQLKEAKKHAAQINKFDALMLDAQHEGATSKQLQQARDTLSAELGTHGRRTAQWLNEKLGIPMPPTYSPINQAMQTGMSTVMSVANLWVLGLSTLTSLADPLGIAVRTGSLKQAASAFSTGIRASISKDRNQLIALAETVGSITDTTTKEALAHGYNMAYMTPRVKRMNDMFFKGIGLEQWTKTTRLMAVEAAQGFLKMHDPDSPSGSKTLTKHSARFMKELGLKPGDVTYDTNGKVQLLRYEAYKTASKEDKAKDDRVKAAIAEFVDESILRPNPSNRPLWASDPHFILAFHLKSFMYAFQKTILNPLVHEAKNGNYMPLLAVSAYIPTMIAIGILKDVFKTLGDDDDDWTPAYKEQWDTADYLWDGWYKGGMNGIAQPIFDFRRDMDFNQAGPLTFVSPGLDPDTFDNPPIPLNYIWRNLID